MKRLLIASVILTIILTTVGCSTASQQRQEAISQRAQMFALAQAKYPIPQTTNFPAREALVKYTERQDIKGHLYYVYVVADTGTIFGYYVSSTPPVSTNAFLSSTEDSTQYGVLTAPSLDGIYYGGSGASSGAGWFIFDAETDALITIFGFNIFVADQPLAIDAKPILIKAK